MCVTLEESVCTSPLNELTRCILTVLLNEGINKCINKYVQESLKTEDISVKVKYESLTINISENNNLMCKDNMMYVH